MLSMSDRISGLNCALTMALMMIPGVSKFLQSRVGFYFRRIFIYIGMGKFEFLLLPKLDFHEIRFRD